MLFKKINLLLTGILIIILFFNIQFYNDWMTGKVLNVNNNMLDQMQNLDTNFRKSYRWGGSYLAFQDIKNKLVKAGGPNVTLLLPTTEYLRAQGVNDMDMVEPAVFYYFTGINAVWANSPDVARANWALITLKGRGASLKKIQQKSDLDTLVTEYKKYIKYL